MTEIQFRSDFTVDLVNSAAGDDTVLRSMLISTLKDQEEPDEKRDRGRIRWLMQNRHGSPFEHNMMTFRVEAPIFVFREWHRHRIGISINEVSGRYVELPAMFYIPPPERPLVQVGKQGAYEYVAGDQDTYAWLVHDMRQQAMYQYESYQERLSRDIAKEVARMSLGVNIYSAMYWTCNARSMMSFLSLRTKAEPYLTQYQSWDGDTDQAMLVDVDGVFEKNPGGALFPSKPMWEIEACARAMEVVEGAFSDLFPLTHEAFCEFGRVCP